jgi:flagellin
MSVSIRTNVASLNAQRNMTQTQGMLDASLAKLSSGYRIAQAGDDAAGLGISTNLVAQIKSYSQAIRNANDGQSLIQAAEAGLNNSANILTRLRELAMESSSDGVGAQERGYIQTEATALVNEMARVAAVAEYNGTKLLDGVATTLEFQVGVRSTNNDAIAFTTLNATVTALGVASLGVTALSGQASAQAALSTIDAALLLISTARSTIGAAGNRFAETITTIQSFREALAAANSRIMDVDVAEETSNLTKAQILAQAGVSVLAQANQMPQLALKLLQ